MKVFNSLTRKKEDLGPLRTINMYSCGPTVYWFAHIGNLRAYIFMDLLRRTLKFLGYKINGVMNYTDVGHLTSDSDTGDDKMESASKKENKSPYEIADYYINCFNRDLSLVNVSLPEHPVRATSCINEMIEFVKGLEQKGYTYIIDDGVYFDVKKFSGYGKLSNKDMDKAGVNRIDENSQKHHPFDFALWKFVPKSHIMKWDSPWGVGCPGWHIECSTMGKMFLGDHIDIHTGGVDHLPIHHENEIAQSDCLEGHKVVDKWMHVEFLQVNGGKMGKSLGNLYTLEDLKEKGYAPEDYRYLNLQTHYRKSLNFTFEGLTASKNALQSLISSLKNCYNSNNTDKCDLAKYKQDFTKAIEDDLNIPLALGTLWSMLKNEKPCKELCEMAYEFDKVLGLNLKTLVEDKQESNMYVPSEVKTLAEKRWQAKQNRQFAEADDLRKKITEQGYSILDSKQGYEIKKLN